MKSIGSLFVFLGAGSLVLNRLGIEFIWLIWIDNWGPNVGMAIRIGMIAVGAVLWLVGSKRGSPNNS